MTEPLRITIPIAGDYVLVVEQGPLPVPVPPLPPARHPIGKGYYIWNLSRCGGGNPARITEMALAAGLSWVTIKLHDGPNEHANTRQNLAAVTLALQSAGIKVWGWGYEYGILPEAEASKAVELTNRYGLTGYIMDVEHEYKGKRDQARRFCDTIRAKAPDLPLGLASYRYPKLHGEIAWDVWLAISDFHNQQLYWMGTSLPTSPEHQLIRSRNELLEKRDLPMVPTGVASPNDGDTWRVTVPQLDNFHAAARKLNLPGICYWSWEHAERVDPSWWVAIARQEWRQGAA